MDITEKKRNQPLSVLLAALSRRSILPSCVSVRLSSVLGYNALDADMDKEEGVERRGSGILITGINLLTVSIVAAPLATLFGAIPPHLAAAAPVAVLVFLILLPKIIGKGSEIRDLLDAAHSFEVFATVLFATGNLGLATKRASQTPGKASHRFRSALISMRNGEAPDRAVLRSFSGEGICLEWVKSAVNGRSGGISPVITNWYAEVHTRILKAEDMLSLLVALSTILPIGLSMAMAVWGLLSTPLSALLILAFSVVIGIVFCWFKGLEAILS